MGENTRIDLQNKGIISLPFTVSSKAIPKKILSEDDFSQNISQIIERDFFPDIPTLRTHTEYFEALEKNDLVKLREIQIRLGKHRIDTGTTDLSNTPLTFETPDGGHKTRPVLSTTQLPVQSNLSALEEKNEGQENIDDTAEIGPIVSLDSFLARNTSEDSASFAEILKEADRKHQVKHGWLFEKEKEQQLETEDMLVVPSIEDQAAGLNRSAHINSWQYHNQNTVMYVPEGVRLSATELIELQKHKPREIVHENTRFHHNPFSNATSKEAMQKAASFRALINQGKIGHDGKEIQGGQSPQVNGYSFVGMPSPAPGVSESPLMTWGEIEDTPARLDSDSVTSTPGPVFKIPAWPKRDRLALELSERASKAHRAKKEEAMRQVTRRFASPSPSMGIGLSSSERLSSMSPAAQRLASKRLGIQTSADKALLASYTPSPSPSHRLPGTSTPVSLTPDSKRSTRSSQAGSPAVATPSLPGSNTPTAPASLTDHLLHLPKRPRKSAADFF